MRVADLEDWRSVMGLSKSAAAEAIGISRQHYSSIISGAQKLPKWAPLVCAALFHRIKPWPEGR